MRLLSDAESLALVAEAYRALKPNGMLCLVSLTKGVTVVSRIVSSLWMAAFRTRPSLVGGCRPIRLDSYIDADHWQLEHRSVVTPFGVPSEVLLLNAKEAPNKSSDTRAYGL